MNKVLVHIGTIYSLLALFMTYFFLSIVSVSIPSINKITGLSFIGKLYLVDLAGSERILKSGSTGERMNEACNINQRYA